MITRRLSVGDTVVVDLLPLQAYSIWITRAMKQYQGRKMKVSKVGRFDGAQYVELEGAVCTWTGIPYTFMKDGLSEVDD